MCDDSPARWPSRAVLVAICDQAKRFTGEMRMHLCSARIGLARGTTSREHLEAELAKFSLLFQGWSREDFQRIPPGLAPFVAATVGPLESPELRQELARIERVGFEAEAYGFTHRQTLGWGADVESRFLELDRFRTVFNVYFGQMDFVRNRWTRDVAVLRRHVESNLARRGLESRTVRQIRSTWLKNAIICRERRYLGANAPGPSPDWPDLVDPPYDVEDFGTFASPGPNGDPDSWLTEVDGLADQLTEALAAEHVPPEEPRSARQDVGERSDAEAVDSMRSAIAALPEDHREELAPHEELAGAAVNEPVFKDAHANSDVREVKVSVPELGFSPELSIVRYADRGYRVTPKGMTLLQALVMRAPDWVSDWEALQISKPSAVKKGLPKVLRDLIETKSGSGYRLRPVDPEDERGGVGGSGS